jgi:hypothetical protein
MKMGNFGKNLNIKLRETNSKKQSAKSKFVDIVRIFDELDKRSLEIESFGIDLTNYEDAHFTLIEHLIFELYNDFRTQMIMWYVYERMDEEGNLLPLLVTDENEDESDDEGEDDEDEEGEEVYIETPEQLYDFIRKLEKLSKK